MPQTDIVKLIDALKEAKAAADAIPTQDTGGTCNFDSPEIELPGMKEQELKKIVAPLGLLCSGWGKGCFHIFGYAHAQGSNQTVKAEAFARVLKARGFNAGVYYAMD